MANLVSQKAKMTFSLAGKNRPNKPDPAVLDAIQGAVTKALGPGYTVNVYSGKEHPGQQTGSNRHKTGLAADVHIIGPDGKTLNASKNKQQMLEVAKAFKELGGMGVGLGTDYMGGVGIHLDMFTPGPNQDSAWGNIGNAMQGWLDSFYRDPASAQIQAQLPDQMDVPRSLAQATAIEQAYRDPFRALDVIPSRPALPSRPQTLNPPQRLAPAPVGRVTRSQLEAIPASLTPAPVGKVERAPLGPVGQFTKPATSLAHPVSVAKPTNLAAAPVGRVTQGPALAPATPNAATLAAQYGQYRPSTVTSMPTVAGMPSIPAPTGLPAAKPVAQPLQHPISVPTPPAPVLAPALVQQRVVQDRPIASVQAPPQAPRATAYDVYNGLADKALDNTGMNTVGRLPDGTTTVTNKYGVTTGMTPYGKQTAVGAPPSLPGIKGPTASKIGGAIKGAIPSVAGSTVGGLLGGPIGALIGAALARAATQPGGLLSGQQSFQTNAFGTINAAKAQGGHAFPDAPSGGYGSGGSMGASFSNRSADGMRGISPGAAAAIGAGKGGLY